MFLQVEIINELAEDKTITVYRCGPLVDLCRGPHIPNTSFVKAFACLKVMNTYMCDLVHLCKLCDGFLSPNKWNFQASSSYWRGRADRASLQRVYGISFPDGKQLKVLFIIAT